MSFPPHGFGIPLVDFACFVLFVLLSDRIPYKPSYRLLFFALCMILALLFFAAWLVDLGARL